MNAAAAATPPRASARPAESSSSAATFVVRARRGLRAVPRVTVGVDRGVGRLRERAVRLAPVFG